MFLQIVNKIAMIHKVVVHDYCLMENHYHLLIETQTDNLSLFMRFVSANYAQYFNKKTKRTGHLWQNRYKSRYVTSEIYLYTLIRYIEYNTIEEGGFLEVKFSEEDLSFLQKEQNRKIEKKENMIVLSKSKSLEEHFMDVKSKEDRNIVNRLFLCLLRMIKVEIERQGCRLQI